MEPRVTFWLFPHSPRGQTPQPQNGSNDVDSRKDVPFAVKIATFHTPWSPGPQKGQKFCKFLDLEIFRSIWPLTLEVQRKNNPYSSSELSESDIVNRQSGGEKLKYILKFYIGGTRHVISRMRNDDLALCLWAHDVWGGISRKPLEIETLVQRTTNRKWPIPSPMVTWSLDSGLVVTIGHVTIGHVFDAHYGWR